MPLRKILAYLLALLGVCIMIHQYVNFGNIWDWNDALHHEWIAGVIIAFALGILVGEGKHE